MVTKTLTLSKAVRADVIKAANLGANGATATNTAKTLLACAMTEAGATREMDKAVPSNPLGLIYADFMPAYLAAYAKPYGDKPVASAIAANDIKVLGRKADDSEKKELNKARNAAASMWKAALQVADPIAKGANEKADKAATESDETESGEQGAAVTKLDRETCAAFLANGDVPTAELLLWATGPGLAALRKWAGKTMPQPK